jgi:hypothetical protein
MENIIDHLDEDPIVNKQKWAVLLFYNKSKGVLCAGMYETYTEALIRCKELKKKNKIYDIKIGENGKWLAHSPDTEKFAKTQRQLSYESKNLNTLVGIIKKNIDDGIEKHDQRHKNLILNKEKLEDADEKPEAQPETQPEVQPEVQPEPQPEVAIKTATEELVEENETKFEINKVSGQKWMCYSFCAPIDKNGNNLIKENIWGIKTRCAFNTKEEADKYAEQRSQIDKYFDIFVGKPGKLYSFDTNTKSVLETKYKNEKLQKIIDKHTKIESNVKSPDEISSELRKNELLQTLRNKQK